MSDYFFGRFADIVDASTQKSKFEKTTGIKKITEINATVEKKRVKELKPNFLNKYIYSAVAILILLIVAIFYFVSR